MCSLCLLRFQLWGRKMPCRSWCSEWTLVSFSCFPWINHGVSWSESHLRDSEGPQGASRGGVSSPSGLRLFPKFTQDKPCEINLVVARVAPAGIFLAKEEIQC